MAGFQPQPFGTFGNAAVLTPSDTVDTPAGSIYVGVSGDITCIPAGQSTQETFKAVPVGFFPVAVSRVMATGTTATNLLAL